MQNTSYYTALLDQHVNVLVSVTGLFFAVFLLPTTLADTQIETDAEGTGANGVNWLNPLGFSCGDLSGHQSQSECPFRAAPPTIWAVSGYSERTPREACELNASD